MMWIFDDAATASLMDRQLLFDYLAQHNIAAEGYFHEALQDDEGWAWRYPAYAVKCFASDQTLEQKLQLLCSKRGGGKNEQLEQKLRQKVTLFSRVNRAENQEVEQHQQIEQNDIERNYQNVLVEFHALYALTALMGYQFVGWDQPSGKQGVNPAKNCDLALTRDGKIVFADAKDCSSEILTQCEIEHDVNGETVSVTHFDPKLELVRWLTDQVREVDEKGADLLVCHLPGWGLEGFGPQELKRYLDEILPSVLTWTDYGPHWQISSSWVKQIIIVKRIGCFVIELDGINATQHQ